MNVHRLVAAASVIGLVIGLVICSAGCEPVAPIGGSADAPLAVLPPDALPPVGTLSPANVQPVLFGDDVDGISFIRVDNDGSENIVAFEKRVPIFDQTAYVLDVGVEPDGEEVDVEARCDDCPPDTLAALSGRWPRSDVDDTTAPVFDLEAAEVTATAFNYESLSYTHYTISVTLPALDEPVAMRFTGDEVDVVLKPLSSPDFPHSFNVAGAEARRLCVFATAIDVAGNETEFPDEICVQLDPDVNSSSCAQAGAQVPFLAAIALALLGRRRGAGR